MATSHRVELTWGSSSYRVDLLDHYDVTLSMLEAGTGVTFTAWGSSADDETAWGLLTDRDFGLKIGDPFWLKIDDVVVFTGRVETLEAGDSNGARGGFDVTFSGRDLSGPAITWDADPTLSLKGATLSEALKLLFDTLGLPVRIGEHADPAASLRGLRPRRNGRFTTHVRTHSRPVSVNHPNVGERVWQVAERIVRGLGYRLFVAPSDDATCNVVVDAPNYGGARLFAFVRELDERGLATAASNILHGREVLNGRDVPTEVTVFAHAPRGDTEGAHLARTVTNGYLLSPEITRGKVSAAMPAQPRYLRSDQAKTDEAARQEASRAIAEAMERFRVYRCTVHGHGQNGHLYAPNLMAHVRDDKLGLREDMLLTRCTLSGGRAMGQTTKLELVPDGALSMDPVR